MQHTDAEELARARLAYVSAGRRGLSAPRRALADTHAIDDDQLEAHPPADSAEGAAMGEATTSLRWWPRLTLRHLVVVATVVLCGVGVAVAALGRSAATDVPIAPVSVSAVAPSPPSPSPVVLLRVHVAGAVREPGVVSLPEGTIVQDAISAAGGLAEDADPAQLNLAAPVSDGMQVIIGTAAEPWGEVVGAAPDSAQQGAGGPVNLNSATRGDLESLPGVGPVMAEAIIAWREENGRFSSVEELQEISGIGPKTFQKLQPLVTV